MSIRAVLFDAGNTLLTIDYPLLRAQIAARGHDVSLAAVMRAERLERMRLDHEQAAPATRERRGAGRYLRYLLDALGVTDEADVAAIAAWRRAYNLPVGLCHRADVEAAEALRRLRAAHHHRGHLELQRIGRDGARARGTAVVPGFRHRLHGGRGGQTRSTGV